MKTAFSLIALAATFVLCHTPAFAEKETTDVQARHHFEEGTKAFNLGEFKRAVTEYKAAYNIKPDAVFLYNIAQSYRLDGDLQDAVFFYRSYLRNSASAPNRREVESRIRQLEAQIQSQRTVTTAPPNSTVPPGGAATSPSAEPPPTETTPPATAATAPPPATTPAATAPPESSNALTASAPPPGKERTPVYKKWWLWTAVGVVAVGVAVGVGVGVATSSPSAPSSHFGTTTLTF